MVVGLCREKAGSLAGLGGFGLGGANGKFLLEEGMEAVRPPEGFRWP